jgi:DNA polymerase (family X)
MNNVDIAEILELTAKLLDLHDRDEMRSKTYLSSIYTIERLDQPLEKMEESQLLSIRGIGRLMSKNIKEIIESGTLAELQDLIYITPSGIFDIFKVKGLGVKKIKILWQEVGIDNINDLKIACLNNKIAGIKGFGGKTQETILDSLAFLQAQEGKLRMHQAQALSTQIRETLQELYPEAIEVGQVIRKCEVVDLLQFLVFKEGFGGLKLPETHFQQNMKDSSPGTWRGTWRGDAIKIEIEKITKKDLIKKTFIKNASENHLKKVNSKNITLLSHVNEGTFETETELYESFGFPYIVPEMREGQQEFEWIQTHSNSELVTWETLKGTLHNHSTYSDGKNTLEEMANYAQSLGLTYFGIADHSQTAQYAGGLKPETVLKQQQEIDRLNINFKNFKILKGIESDILPNGDLDYEADILQTFDYVVASVHSVLNMDIEKATQRLIKAIENPYTTILGHLSGRLLLSRNGYPLHYQKIIDACAANQVIMELNASPYRLDIDWRWIMTCMDNGVMISINPDAHEVAGLHDMHYGVAVARKAGLTQHMTFNCLTIEALLEKTKKR